MTIAIRDDDLCAYSSYSVFREIYDTLSIPVSAAVIPCAVPNHGDSFPYGEQWPRNTPLDLSHNKTLVSHLSIDVKQRKVEVLLHGYTHEYLWSNNRWIPEMQWKSRDRLRSELRTGKNLLEAMFNQPIRVFVAPSQIIGPEGVSVLEELGLAYSGTPNRWKDRRPSLRHAHNLAKRHWERLFYGRPCSKYFYGRHVEIPIVGLADLDVLKKYYFQCKKHNWDLVVVVHYWRLVKYPEEYKQLADFVTFVKSDNGKFGFVSECLPSRGNK